MTTKASNLGFFNLPTSIRERIYAYLLLPHPKEDVTTINYTLDWPYLWNPSNTTFAGPTQIDLCTCPWEEVSEEVGERVNKEVSEDANKDANNGEDHQSLHIHTRYHCLGPEVRFKSPRDGLWLLQAAHGQFNIPRPATEDELHDRPSAAVLQICRQIHDEALPILYRDRDFFFLTGPCSRGIYQSYATLQWLKQMNPTARANVEILSLLVQPYEEDCDIAEVEGAYAELSAYIRDHLPRFKWLCLDVWDEEVYQATSAFLRLFDRAGMGIVVRQPRRGDRVDVFVTTDSFLKGLENNAELAVK